MLNKCPTKRLKHQVPEAVWTVRKPTVKHLRVFGSLCFKHVPDQKRKKLQDKCAPMILVGYHPTGAYRLSDPVNQKVEISRDVVVDEPEFWDWKSNTSSLKQLSFPILEEEMNQESVDVNTGADQCQSLRSQSLRSQRERHPPTRFTDYELFTDNAITHDGDLVDIALLVDAEPLNYDEAVRKKA